MHKTCHWLDSEMGRSVSIGLLTILTPSLALLVHVYLMTSLGATCSGPPWRLSDYMRVSVASHPC